MMDAKEVRALALQSAATLVGGYHDVLTGREACKVVIDVAEYFIEYIERHVDPNVHRPPSVIPDR